MLRVRPRLIRLYMLRQSPPGSLNSLHVHPPSVVLVALDIEYTMGGDILSEIGICKPGLADLPSADLGDGAIN
jgi:hypothetical protein